MAFSLKSLFQRPSVKSAEAETAYATVTDAGASIGQRPISNPVMAGGYTLERAASILLAAESGEPTAVRAAFLLFDRTFERDLHTAGVLNGLVQAIVGLKHVVRAKEGDNRRIARAIAADVQAAFNPSGAVRLAESGIVTSGLTHGIGPAEIMYETSPTRWEVRDLVQKPAHWFTFDRRDGRTPLLLASQHGQPAEPLERGKMIAFCPRRVSAMQIKNSLGWVLCWAYVLKALLDSDKFDFIGTFGKPIIYGKYPRNAEPGDVHALRQAVTALNSSFRGVFRDDLEIQFQEVARAGTDMHEKASRLIDEYVSKFIWANTLSSDAGGAASYALGKVHMEGKYDVVRSYAQQLAAALQRDFVEPYVLINYGADAPMPTLSIEVEEAEDEVAGSTVVKNLAGAGVKLSAKEVREKFGFSEPAEGEETIGGQAAPVQEAVPVEAAPVAPNYRHCPMHSAHSAGQVVERDAIDDLADSMLAEYEAVAPTTDALLGEAVLNAGSVEAAVAALLAIAKSGDIEALQALFTVNRTAARAGGRLGGEA
jgi:phage gp29-like protein